MDTQADDRTESFEIAHRAPSSSDGPP
jgi:hypothetical protein